MSGKQQIVFVLYFLKTYISMHFYLYTGNWKLFRNSIKTATPHFYCEKHSFCTKKSWREREWQRQTTQKGNEMCNSNQINSTRDVWVCTM